MMEKLNKEIEKGLMQMKENIGATNKMELNTNEFLKCVGACKYTIYIIHSYYIDGF